MRRLSLYILLISLHTACSFHSANSQQSTLDSIPDKARRVMQAYPSHIIGYERDSLIFSDSTRLLFNDGISRTISQMHIEQDVKDIFFQEYDTTLFPPEYGYDPGRYRCAAFFDKIYGATFDEVTSNLVWVDWCPSFGCEPVRFSGVAGAAEALKRVSDEFEQHPELANWVRDAQTFNYRTIFGTTRKSPHSYGIAIDIAVARSHYWRYNYPEADEQSEIDYLNSFDMRVVEIFERHGFIWGGRWYHFDTMHFEYRPEMFTTPKKELSETSPTKEVVSPN
jgi:hypothetical protein